MSTLRIGVTGHRYLADPAAVTRAVERELDNLERRYAPPGHGNVEFTVVSALARGADRLVAEAVLRRPHSRLEVVTPMPLDEYRKDFAAAEDRAEFERLLTRAASVSELDAPGTGSGLPRTVADTKALRETAYLAAGRHIVDGCDVLLCLWDGLDARGAGGTAEVAHYATTRGRAMVLIEADQRTDPPLGSIRVNY